MSSSPTDVVIDATVFGTAGGYRGIGSYVRNLLQALAAEPSVAVRALATATARLPDGIARVPVWRLAPGRFRSLEHDLLLPLDLRRADPEVIHSPSSEPPPRWPAPLVQTLFDVIPLRSDDPDLTHERRRWRVMAPRYRRADAIIAISRHAADEGIAALGLDPRRVTVAHLGVGDDFRPAANAAIDTRPYVLLVGEYSCRKGYEKAFATIGAIADAGYPHRIRVAGRIAPHIAAKVSDVVALAARSDRIDLLGYVDDIVAEYQGAEALIVTSSAEGFGLPALEAMACGTPVVAFANTSASEVLDDAGVLVPDGDVTQMTRETKRVLTDDGWRKELVARGVERAKAFTWDRCASIHAEVYRSVVL